MNSLRNIVRLPRSALFLLLSLFTTSIGNGMFLLTLGVKLYEITGSINSFGYMIIFQYVINFLIDIFAGYYVDNSNPKRIAVSMDLIRGISILIVIMISIKVEMTLLYFIIVVIINLAKPLYRGAVFSIAPSFLDGDELMRYNILKSSCMQTGQMIGIALVGPILAMSNGNIVFVIDAFTYLLAGLFMSFVVVKSTNTKKNKEIFSRKNFIEDWRKVFSVLKNDRLLLQIMIIATIDFMIINIINMNLMPIVKYNFGSNMNLISVFDGAFAVGVIVVVPLVNFVRKRITENKVIMLALLLSAAMFILLPFSTNWITTTVIFLTFGVLNIMTGSIYITFIQQRSKGFIKGKISAIRKMLLSFLSMLILPVISSMSDVSLHYGLITAGVVCLMYFVFFILFIFKSRVNLQDDEHRIENVS